MFFFKVGILVNDLLQVESVGYLARILLNTEHGGFPVVKYDHETRQEYCYGLISRQAFVSFPVCLSQDCMHLSPSEVQD